MPPPDPSRFPGTDTDYYLEIWRNGRPQAVSPVPNGPHTFSITEHFATTIEFTLGHYPKREHSEPRSWRIGIAGRTGTVPRGGADAADRLGEDRHPFIILEKFEQFLDRYQREAQQVGAMALTNEKFAKRNRAYYMLVFHAVKENKHYAVELVTYTFDRSAASTRHSAEWRLVLEAWDDLSGSNTRGDLESRMLDPDNAVPLRRSAQQELADRRTVRALEGDPVNVQYKYPAGADTAVKEVVTSGNIIEAAAIFRIWQVPNKGVAQVFATASAVQYQAAIYANYATQLADFIKQGNTLATAPIALWRQLAGAFGALQGAARLLVQPVQEYDAFWAVLNCTARELAFSMGLAGVTEQGLRLLGKGDAAALVPPQMLSRPQAPEEQEEWTSGFILPPGVTSWPQLSQFLFQSDAYWLALAAANGAKSAYTGSDGGPLYAGQVVQLPLGVKGTQGNNKGVGALFGADILTGPDGDWVLDEEPYIVVDQVATVAPTDFKIVTGTANLRQAVYCRAITRQGSVKAFPEYGVQRADIGDPINIQIASLAAYDVRSQLLRDPRLADVIDVKAGFDNDEYFLQFTAVPLGPQPDKIAALVPVAVT